MEINNNISPILRNMFGTKPSENKQNVQAQNVEPEKHT